MRAGKKLFSLFLIVLVACSFAPLLQGDVTGVNGDSYFLAVEVSGRNVLFAGESVSLVVQSNASQVAVEIFDSGNVSRYLEFVRANSSVEWVPPLVYGLFTVRASVGGQVCSTWFWLQDTRSFSLAPSVSNWGFAGLDCSLTTVTAASKVSTYSFQASKANAVFETEWLSEVFAKLKPTEYSVDTNNAGCIHIKTYSDKNKIDSWVMNTWFGVKIRVNGTLEKPTAFKWALKAVSGEVLWQLGGLRIPTGNGNLVYDWSDMDSRSTGVSYVLDKTGLKLDVTLETEFDLDPTIFEDGFESGDFSAWTSTYTTSGETCAVSTDTAHHGSNSGKFISNGGGGTENAFVYKSGFNHAELYVRAYVNVTQSGIADDTDQFNFIILLDTSTTVGLAQIGWRQDSGTVKWYIGYFNGATFTRTYSTSATRNLNEWYCVELYWLLHASAGICRGYVNGNLILEATGLDTDNAGNAFYVGAGLITIGNCAACTAYIDCVVVADAYIGPEATNYVLALSLSAPVSYAVYAQWQAKQTSTMQTAEAYTLNQQWSATGTLTLNTGETYMTTPQWTAQNTLSLSTSETYTILQQWSSKHTLALTTEESYTYLSQGAYKLAVPLTCGFQWLFTSQANYKHTPQWTTALTYSALQIAAYKQTLTQATPLTWATSQTATYNKALTLATSHVFSLLSQATINIMLPLSQAVTWLTNTKATWNLALPFTEALTWLTQTKTAYNLALPLIQGFTWLTDITHIEHVIAQIVTLAWTTTLSFTTQLQAAFNTVLEWVTGQTLLTSAWTGLQYLLGLTWQTALTWATSPWHLPLSMDAFALAAIAFMIAIVAFALVGLVLFKRDGDS